MRNVIEIEKMINKLIESSLQNKLIVLLATANAAIPFFHPEQKSAEDLAYQMRWIVDPSDEELLTALPGNEYNINYVYKDRNNKPSIELLLQCMKEEPGVIDTILERTSELTAPPYIRQIIDNNIWSLTQLASTFYANGDIHAHSGPYTDIITDEDWKKFIKEYPTFIDQVALPERFQTKELYEYAVASGMTLTEVPDQFKTKQMGMNYLSSADATTSGADLSRAADPIFIDKDIVDRLREITNDFTSEQSNMINPWAYEAMVRNVDFTYITLVPLESAYGSTHKQILLDLWEWVVTEKDPKYISLAPEEVKAAHSQDALMQEQSAQVVQASIDWTKISSISDLR